MDLAIEVLSLYGLIIIPLLLLGGAVGMPFPEDLVTLTTGYLVYKGVLPFYLSLGVLYMSIMLADCTMYATGYFLQAKVIPKEKLNKAAVSFARWGLALIFGARFVFGARGPMFLAAGALRIPFHRFLIADILAGAIFIPGLFFFAFRTGEGVEKVARVIQESSSVVGLIIVFLVITGAAVWYIRKRRQTPLSE